VVAGRLWPRWRLRVFYLRRNAAAYAIQHASLMIQAAAKVLYVTGGGSYDGRRKPIFILITDIHSDHMVPARWRS